MPIRFRCRYCHQLMGISRRKAGTMVRCPSCQAQLMVPETGEAEPPGPTAAPPVAVPLFERSDFEEMLRDPIPAAPPPPAEKPPAPPPAEPLPPLAEPVSFPSLPAAALPARPVGLVLSPTQATWLTVAAILLLALAFGAGLLIGHYWMG